MCAHMHTHTCECVCVLVWERNFQICRERLWVSNTHQRIKWGIVESSLPITVERKSQNNGIMDDLMAMLISSTG